MIKRVGCFRKSLDLDDGESSKSKKKINSLMIITFKDEEVKALFEKKKSLLYQNIKKVALRKLILLDEAKDLRELSKLPNNRLEKLKETKKTYSIRINDQYRIVFDWIDTSAYNVLINKHDKNYGK